MIEGLSHITLIVRDLTRTTERIETVFDGREVYASGERTFSVSREKLFLVGDIWIAIMEGEPLKERNYNHIAFEIAPGAVEDYRARRAPWPDHSRIAPARRGPGSFHLFLR
jgi:fosfomycin resistance protein FosX